MLCDLRSHDKDSLTSCFLHGAASSPKLSQELTPDYIVVLVNFIMMELGGTCIPVGLTKTWDGLINWTKYIQFIWLTLSHGHHYISPDLYPLMYFCSAACFFGSTATISAARCSGFKVIERKGSSKGILWQCLLWTDIALLTWLSRLGSPWHLGSCLLLG